MTWEERLNSLGIAVEATLERYGGDEDMLLRFLKMFSEDGTLALLKDAVKSHNQSAMERTAHALKGITANLGMEELSAMYQCMVKMIRQGDTGDMEALFAQICEEHQKMVRGIRELKELSVG
ncbi:Hpt domain-containing protein [Zongyangia hominis]|uniref:Hpt domain-containing protein n=1 Tax=Zongyangia hominis TaxID=2763677 RepID=A0A926EC22_9FIRM|nr:Hpt domain-containing protein [Zongyangia hominis]MBC8569484.1 Hpt domain-containing protein [Zongyangia hominis]